MRKSRSNERGSALILAMVVTLVVAGMSGSYLTLSISKKNAAFQEVEREKAFYAAEAALKRFEKEPAATSPGQEVDRSADAARDTGHPHDLRTMLGNRAAAQPERDQARRPETDTGRNTGHERGL